MLEVTRRGRLPVRPTRFYTGTCRNCHCTVRCTSDEFENGDRESHYGGFVSCPTEGCKRKIDVCPHRSRETRQGVSDMDWKCG